MNKYIHRVDDLMYENIPSLVQDKNKHGSYLVLDKKWNGSCHCTSIINGVFMYNLRTDLLNTTHDLCVTSFVLHFKYESDWNISLTR